MMSQRVYILGNKIDCFKEYRDLYAYILKDVRSHCLKGYVTVNNVHTMMEGFWDASYQSIINEGYLSIPDGKPLQVVGRLKGNAVISRLFGPSVMEKFIDWGRNDNVSHFFFGSSEENLMKLKSAINTKYPGAKISGMVSPPYRHMSEWDNSKFIKAINDSKADFIWIGLGAPKQEIWMHKHYKEIDNGILFGIGAGFDYLAGNTKHAPEWMKNASLEWFYRLIQEPRRLWKRYFKTIPPFVIFSLLEMLGIKVKHSNNNKN